MRVRARQVSRVHGQTPSDSDHHRNPGASEAESLSAGDPPEGKHGHVGLERVQIVGPPLHHLPALVEEHGAVAGAAVGIADGVS